MLSLVWMGHVGVRRCIELVGGLPGRGGAAVAPLTLGGTAVGAVLTERTSATVVLSLSEPAATRSWPPPSTSTISASARSRGT